MLGRRQNTDLTAQEKLARVAQHHASAGVIRTLGAVNTLDITRLVEGENIADLQRADDFLAAIDQRHVLARLEAAGQGSVDWKCNRNGPGIRFALVQEHFVVEDALERRLIHRSDQRTEAA